MDEHPENDQGQQPRGRRRGLKMHGGRVQRQNRGRSRRGLGQRCVRWNKGHCCGTCCQPWPYNYWRVQLNIRRSTLSHFFKQSLSINIPLTVMCKCVLLKWLYGIHNNTAFQYSNCHTNCCHSLHQVILTECTVILTTWLCISPILFVNNDTRTSHSDDTDMVIDINAY